MNSQYVKKLNEIFNVLFKNNILSIAYPDSNIPSIIESVENSENLKTIQESIFSDPNTNQTKPNSSKRNKISFQKPIPHTPIQSIKLNEIYKKSLIHIPKIIYKSQNNKESSQDTENASNYYNLKNISHFNDLTQKKITELNNKKSTFSVNPISLTTPDVKSIESPTVPVVPIESPVVPIESPMIPVIPSSGPISLTTPDVKSIESPMIPVIPSSGPISLTTPDIKSIESPVVPIESPMIPVIPSSGPISLTTPDVKSIESPVESSNKSLSVSNSNITKIRLNNQDYFVPTQKQKIDIFRFMANKSAHVMRKLNEKGTMLIPAYERGTSRPITSPTLAMVGEGGPEHIVPQSANRGPVMMRRRNGSSPQTNDMDISMSSTQTHVYNNAPSTSNIFNLGGTSLPIFDGEI